MSDRSKAPAVAVSWQDVLGLAGTLLTGAGASLIYRPAGLIVVGVIFLLVAIAAAARARTPGGR